MLTSTAVNLSTVPVPSITNAVDWTSAWPDPGEWSLDTKEDPFVASMASYRRWAVYGEPRWQDFTAIIPTEEDRRLAEGMKEHYRNKIALNVLKSKPLSAFNADLYALLIGETLPKQKHLGLLYRLPYLYAEDIARIELWDSLGDYPALTGSIEGATWKLTPFRSILRSRRNNEVAEYWYLNEQQQPVLWRCSTRESTYMMVDAINRWPSVRIKGTYIKQTQRPGSTQKDHWTVIHPVLDMLC